MMKNLTTILIISTLFLLGCKDKLSRNEDTLVIHESADPETLNPLNSSSANARVIIEQVFSQVLGSEVSGKYNLLPILSQELPKISEIKDGEFKGGMKIEYEIRPEATWDNGTPITAHDYIFTIKSILNPKTNCEHLKSYYDWVGDIVVDSANPKKFTIYSNKKYFKIEEFSGYYTIPEYNYDPKGLMKKFTIRDMNTPEKREALKSNEDILNFASEFNSEKFQNDPKHIVGFGPYIVKKITRGQEVVLERKENWWGDKFKDLRQFWAFPKKIVIKIINDQKTSFTALKDGQLDAYASIPAKDFKELLANKEMADKFRLEKVDRLSYSYLGFNTRSPKLKDIKVRKALAHATNRKKINDLIADGEAILTESFAHPSQPVYNTSLSPFEFDIKKANSLLDESGWKDSDGDGIRDKVIDGEKIQLNIDYKFAKSEIAKNTALIIKEDYKQIGVGLNIIEKEWTILLQEMDKLDIEMYSGGFTLPARISDPKQIWHTTNAKPGGDNKSGWGNAISDKLIDEIGVELDAEKRKQNYLKLQQMIHDDVPVIFMFSTKNRIAVSKKFDVELIMSSPGYQINEFKPVQAQKAP